MTDKATAIRLLLLLSALESWSFSTNNHLPKHTMQELCDLVEILRGEVLA